MRAPVLLHQSFCVCPAAAWYQPLLSATAMYSDAARGPGVDGHRVFIFSIGSGRSARMCRWAERTPPLADSPLTARIAVVPSAWQIDVHAQTCLALAQVVARARFDAFAAGPAVGGMIPRSVFGGRVELVVTAYSLGRGRCAPSAARAFEQSWEGLIRSENRRRPDSQSAPRAGCISSVRRRIQRALALSPRRSTGRRARLRAAQPATVAARTFDSTNLYASRTPDRVFARRIAAQLIRPERYAPPRGLQSRIIDVPSDLRPDKCSSGDGGPSTTQRLGLSRSPRGRLQAVHKRPYADNSCFHITSARRLRIVEESSRVTTSGLRRSVCTAPWPHGPSRHGRRDPFSPASASG